MFISYKLAQSLVNWLYGIVVPFVNRILTNAGLPAYGYGIAIAIFGLAVYGAVSLVAPLARWILDRRYKIQSIPVTDIESKDAYFQVENIGRANLRCAARLVKITVTDKSKREKRRSVDVNEVNPNGLFLGWTNGVPYETLQIGIPRTANLISGGSQFYPEGIYGQYSRSVYTANFIFSGYQTSKRLDLGYYSVSVDFLRWNGSRYVKLLDLEDTFELTSDGVKWMKRKKGK